MISLFANKANYKIPIYTHTHTASDSGGPPWAGSHSEPLANGPVDIRKHTETETTSDRRGDLGLAVHLLSP